MIAEGSFKQAFQTCLEGIAASVTLRSSVYGMHFCIHAIICMDYDLSIKGQERSGLLSDLRMFLQKAYDHPFGMNAMIRSKQLLCDFDESINVLDGYESIIQMSGKGNKGCISFDVELFQSSVAKLLRSLSFVNEKKVIAQEILELFKKSKKVNMGIVTEAAFVCGIKLAQLAIENNTGERKNLLDIAQKILDMDLNWDTVLTYEQIGHLYETQITIRLIQGEFNQIQNLCYMAVQAYNKDQKEQELLNSEKLLSELPPDAHQFQLGLVFDLEKDIGLNELASLVQQALAPPPFKDLKQGELIKYKRQICQKKLNYYTVSTEWDYSKFFRLNQINSFFEATGLLDNFKLRPESVKKEVYLVWSQGRHQESQTLLACHVKRPSSTSNEEITKTHLVTFEQSTIDQLRTLVNDLFVMLGQNVLAGSKEIGQVSEKWDKLLKGFSECWVTANSANYPTFCLQNLHHMNEILSYKSSGWPSSPIAPKNPYLENFGSALGAIDSKETKLFYDWIINLFS